MPYETPNLQQIIDDFRGFPYLQGLIINAMFAAFIKVPNWRRVKRERRKAYERMMARFNAHGSGAGSRIEFLSAAVTPDAITHLAKRHRIKVTLVHDFTPERKDENANA